MKEPISVGLGEFVVSQSAEDILVAYGLGSCLAIGMVDLRLGISGLLHAVLPECKNSLNGQRARYVNSGIEALLEGMQAAGAHPQRLVVRMAGGSNMLMSAAMGSAFDIGSRNIQAARETISRLQLGLRSEEVGGSTGRTVRLYVRSGRMTVRKIGGAEEVLD